MFQRFHEIKSNQENDMMHSTGGESRSSTPGLALDGRVMFTSHASPLPSQHTPITSYPSASSPSVMTASPAMYYGTKYLASTPPEAHRYSSDSFRVSSDSTDQDRYVIDTSRMSVDPYRQLHNEAQNRTHHSEFQRIRVEDQLADTYHRPVEDIYSSPIDLQRVPETNSQQLLTAQRLVSELQRMHADGLRSVSSEQSLRHDLPTDSISPTDSSSSYRGSLQDPVRPPSEPNYRIVQESMLRTHSDPQRLVQESFKDFFPPPDSPKPSMDILRSSVDQRALVENERYLLTSENLRSDSQRFSNSLRINVNDSQEIMSEDPRNDAHTPQNCLPENFRVESDHVMLSETLRVGAITPQSMDENIRVGTETHHIAPGNLRLRIGGSNSMILENHRTGNDSRHVLVPENLKISASDLSHNVDSLRGENGVNSHGIMSENLIIASDGSTHNLMQENVRVGTDTPHNLINETSHSLENIRVGNETPHNLMPENLRVGSSSHSLISNHLRFSSENSRNSLVENLRLIADSHHGILPENLRVVSEASRMVPENLCLTEPSHQSLPEDLHISHTAVNGGTLSSSIDHQAGRMLAHEQSSESSLPIMRSHYDSSNHRIMTENSHSLRIQSPHYSDVYRNDIHDSMSSAAPGTPIPSVQMGDLAGTPAPHYYSSSSYSSAPHNNHYAGYMNDELDERDLRNGTLSLEEKINRGYHDIKPFDQNYPVSMPMMHMPQETMQPAPSIAKPPKPKKPKEPKPPRLPVIHKCNECLRVFKNSTQLKNHMWRHTGEKPFTCDECGSKFTQQGNLRAHRRIHTGERPYQCPDCKTCFTQLSTLKTHQKIHSDERPYQCSECDAAFRQIANLKTHQVTHTGERPHQCDLCDKAFTQKSNLKAHKNRVHTSDGLSTPAKRGRKKNPVAIKPFNCLDCGAKFTMISNLKIHSKLHAGNRPFECDYCGAEFAQRSNMKTHIQRMHGKGPGAGRRRIRCDECPAMFRLKRCLKTHKKRRHPIKSLKIKILRESKYLMNSGSSPASATHQELDEDIDDDDEEDDDEDDEEAEDEDSEEEEVLESQLLTKKSQIPEKNCSSDSREVDVREPIVEIKEPKVEPMDDEDISVVPAKENETIRSQNGKSDVDYSQARSNNHDEDDNSTSSKENDLNNSKHHHWEGRFNIKEEIESSPGTESKDLPLVSSNTS